MDLKSRLKELKPYDLNCNIFDVYSYNGLSMQELLCQFFTKINECVNVSNETLDLAEWLVNEGLEKEVVKKLLLWYEDGSLETLINETLFSNLNNKIDDNKNDLLEEINKVNEEINLNKQMRLFINVKEFGAIGDGVNDDTLAIKEAFNYISNNSTTLYFPSGKYNVSDNFKLNSVVDYTIIGDNAEIKLIKEYQTELIDYLIKVEQSNNFKMSGIILNGNNIGNIQTKQNYGLFVNNTNNCTIENCIFKNFEGNGVYISYEVKNFVGRNNKYLSNSIHGINVTNLYKCTMENELMEYNLGQGFDVVTYKQNYQDLISLNKYKIVNIKNCVIKNNGTGVNESGQPYSSGGKLYGCYLVTVENCIFENNGHDSYKGQQLRICNSNFEENIVNGYIVINNCKFKTNNLKQKAIADFGECEHLVISNCKFDGVYEYPLQIRSRGLVENNEFNCLVDAGGDNGVKIQSSNVVVKNNMFTDIFNGIAILTQIDNTIPQAKETSNIIIENNIIKSAKNDYAIFLKCNNSIIRHNTLPNGNRIDLRLGDNNTVINTGTVKNNATNTLFEGYVGDNTYRSYMFWSGSVKTGTQYFNTQTNKLDIWNGSEWI